MPERWTPGDSSTSEPDQPVGAPPTPEETALAEELAAMQAELAKTPASVVVANHAVGLFQLAAIHLNQRPPNLDDGRLAIDAMAALVDGLAGRLGDDEASLRDALAQVRMAFVALQDAGPDGPATPA
jgi:hypothetical protein